MDDPTLLLDDEVIADSEDENELMGGFAGPAGLGPRQSSPFSAFTATNQHYKPNTTHSSISNFTAGPSAIADYSSRIDSSERRKGKETDIDTSFTSPGGTYTNFDQIASSIADRAKTRQRPTKPSNSASLDVIELTSEDDDELSLKPPKPRPKSIPKIRIKPLAKEKEQSAQVSAVSSVKVNPPQPEAAAAAAAAVPPRPRPRPRPRVKPPAPVTESAAPIAPLPPTSTPPSELPVATSSPHPNPMTSQLPPSDPPLPSLGTAYNDDPNTRAPPIEALFEGPLSSPGSLFSDSGRRSKKRKRNPPESDREIDQLASPIPPRRPFAGQAQYDSSPHGMPPPPTFFAPSSSSSIGRDRNNATPPPPPPPEPEIVDLTMLPPTFVPPPKPKPKKSKKKTDLSMFDDNFGNGGMIILDEDNEDDDFDPREEGSGKKQKKPKAKPKEKSSTKSKSKAKTAAEGSVPGKGKVEVLLDPRPSSSKGKGKGKGKGKPDDKGKKKDDSNSKDVFKSREFIEDSDDELDVIRIRPSGGSTTGAANKPASTSTKCLSNSKATPPAPGPKPAAGPTSKPKEHSPSRRSLSPLSDLDLEMGGAGPSIVKQPPGGAKKRKSIVDSDGEDDDFALAAEESIRVNPASTSAKKRKMDEVALTKKAKKDGKKKGRNVLLSDDDEGEDYQMQETIVKTAKLPKASKQSKKDIHDDDGEEFGAEAREKPDEQKSTPEEIKENVAPPTSKPSIAATPRPSITPKSSAPGSTTQKTPIYARYEIAPRKSSLPMSELIRRANSMPGSPFPSTPASTGPSRLKGLGMRTSLAYSPLLKSSRSMLSKIAPLHPNRRTPPPPPPPPPPRKKSKKELELEEKWEEEMVEGVGGMEAWAVLGDDERREIRKAKWARELGDWDE